MIKRNNRNRLIKCTEFVSEAYKQEETLFPEYIRDLLKDIISEQFIDGVHPLFDALYGESLESNMSIVHLPDVFHRNIVTRKPFDEDAEKEDIAMLRGFGGPTWIIVCDEIQGLLAWRICALQRLCLAFPSEDIAQSLMRMVRTTDLLNTFLVKS